MSRDGAPVDDAVELIGDEVAGDDQAAPEANPRSVLTGDDRGALTELLGADVRFDEPMRRHTTLKIGGPADALAEPSSVDALAALCRLCAARAIPLVVVGGGSNLLVKDGGVRGVVLSTRHLRAISVDGAVMRAEAGVSTGKVLSTAMKHDLGGVEFLGGVPGSLGGGLIMNAGTYLGELKDVTSEVMSVRIADGAIVRRDNAACGFRYRHSDLPATEVVAAATLTLRPRPRAEIEAEVKDLRRRRHDREPKKVASAGSIFKNPTGDFAGRLIEAAALKGTRIGDALCSPVHANWLVNVGAATAADLLALIDLVRGRVHEAHGIALEMEVKVIGDD